MSKDRHHRLHELFTAAVELPVDQRDDWLQQECAGDPALLTELQALLTEDQRSQDPLEAGVRQVLRQRGNGPGGDETLSRTSMLDDFDIAKRHDELPDSDLSSDEFCDQLSEIDILSGDELVKWLESVQPPETREDPQALARQLVAEGKLTEFQASVLLGGKSKKLLIDKYLILDLLDSGGMGMVFKAVHRTMKRVVALKMLPPARFSSPAAVQRFRREVEVAATLEHPNIVTAHDADESKGVHFLVMEYARGRDLYKKVTADGPLSVAQAVQCVLQAAAGLQHAHDKGIIHRDIKPGNLILADTKTIKILDLGLASISERAEPEAAEESERRGDQLTRSGALLGTVAYMAPEQAVDSANVDARCDIYSLGCTFYFLLTGETPYGSDPVESIDRHQTAEIPGLRDKRLDVPEAVDTIYHKMLAKDPNDRQQSMAEVIAALKVCKLPEGNRNNTRTGEPKNVVANASKTKSAKPWRAKRAIGGLIGVTVIGLLSVILLRNEPNEPTPSAPPPDVTDESTVFNDHPPFAISQFSPEEARQLQNTWADFLGVPVEKVITLPGGETLTMVLIPPGEFDMGSSSEELLTFLNVANQANDHYAKLRIPSEGPQHRVRINHPFYLSKYEVTQAQWLSVTGTNPAQFSENPDNPVEQVSWLEVQEAFIKKLNDHVSLTPMRFALPTEAQWEYANRAGNRGYWHCGSDEASLHHYAWSTENSGGKPHPVGQLRSNAFGLYDMQGNVMELCADRYAADYYSNSPVNDPFNSTENPVSVRRGGSWRHSTSWSRSARRGHIFLNGNDHSTGFRLAAAIDRIPSRDIPQWAKHDATISSLIGISDEWKWTVPKKLPEPINSEFLDKHASLSRDGLTLLFTSCRNDSPESDIWMATRTSIDEEFSNPHPLPGGVNTFEYMEEDPWLSSDGQRIYFQSTRLGSPDIWMSMRDSVEEPFGKPKPLGTGINSNQPEWHSVLTEDELTILFSANFRPEGKGLSDLYIAQREKSDQPFREARPLENLNSPGHEVASYLSPDGRLLLFSSSRNGDSKSRELFAAFRDDLNGGFGKPFQIPSPIASRTRKDEHIFLSRDGRELIVSEASPNGTANLYRSRLVRVRSDLPNDPGILALFGLSDEWEWTVPEKLPEPINSEFGEHHCSLSRDGLTLLFTTDRGNSGTDDIWIARRESMGDSFTNPHPLAGEVNTKEYYESSQWLSDDGKRIYFQSNRPGGPGSFDIWWAERESVNESFGEPSPLLSVNSNKPEWTPVLSADELTIVFSASFRSDGKGRGDLYIAQREKRDQPFDEAKPLENLNSPRGEVATYLRRDGRLLFFTSSETVGDRYHQLFAAYRADPRGSFGDPIRIPPPIAAGKLDLSLTLSEDGKELILASGSGEGYETLDLYRSRLVRKDPTPSQDMPQWVEDDPTISSLMGINDQYEWTEPIRLPDSVNSMKRDGWPALSGDGKILIFLSTREGDLGRGDLWMSARATLDDEWSEPRNLGEPLNSAVGEWGPHLSSDGLALLFVSERETRMGNGDLWMSERASVNDEWGSPVRLGAVSSPHPEQTAILSDDRLEMIVAAHRPDTRGQGYLDLYSSTCVTVDEEWSEPENFGDDISSIHNEYPLLFTDNDRLLWFQRNLRGEDRDNRQLYVSRRESREAAWSPPIHIPTTLFNHECCLSADGRTVVMSKDGDLWISQRARKK